MIVALLLVLLGVIFFAIILLASFGLRGWNYASVDIVLSEVNQSFLILPFTLSPAIYTFIVVYAAHSFGYSLQLVWLVSLVIIVIRLIGLVVASRISRVPLARWIIASIVSVIVAYLVNVAVVHEFMNTNVVGPVTLVMIVVSIVGIGVLFSTARFGDLDELASYEKSIEESFERYEKKFGKLLQPEYKKDSVKYLLFFSVMTAEDLNRPRVVRIIENIVSRFRTVSTTGIMQVSAQSVLSDAKSVVLAKELITGSYARHSKKTKDTYSLVRQVAADYNGDAYPDLVIDIFFILKKYSESR
jgi:hypothetical protein